MVKPKQKPAKEPKEKRLYEVTLPADEFPKPLKHTKYKIWGKSPEQAFGYALKRENQLGMYNYFKGRIYTLVKEIPLAVKAKKDDPNQMRLF